MKIWIQIPWHVFQAFWNWIIEMATSTAAATATYQESRERLTYMPGSTA